MASQHIMKPTKQQLEEAVDALADMFPEEAPNLKKYRASILHHLFERTDPADNLLQLKLQPSSGAHGSEMFTTEATVSPCVEACATVCVDVVFFVLGLLDLHLSYDEKITRALLRELGPDTLRGFARAIHEFNVASGVFDKAKALFGIMGGIWKAGGFSAVFKVIKDEMTWWQWVKTGAIALAQLTLWFATDGVAFIAEAALSILSAEQLIEDAIKCDKACS